ncbi:uncharacterized protein LOC112897815 [Panicum hallii]|uniref:uncharacterized protein LOC112897815 n=1 Tax=Panicum hallii TaxID=206008 RepID=UPI000DF4D936|nr:uncharacterized protein LOC112897815 [Panicum hallii]
MASKPGDADAPPAVEEDGVPSKRAASAALGRIVAGLKFLPQEPELVPTGNGAFWDEVIGGSRAPSSPPRAERLLLGVKKPVQGDEGGEKPVQGDEDGEKSDVQKPAPGDEASDKPVPDDEVDCLSCMLTRPRCNNSWKNLTNQVLGDCLPLS